MERSRKKCSRGLARQRRTVKKGGILGAGGRHGRGVLVYLPVAMVLMDIFPTAPCHSGIIAHDYGEDQHDRLSLISLTSVGEVI